MMGSGSIIFTNAPLYARFLRLLLQQQAEEDRVALTNAYWRGLLTER